MTDTKRLRELAEAAHKEMEMGVNTMNSTMMEYVSEAAPQTIIALLDELESVKAQLAEANEVIFEHDKTGLYGFIKRARQYLEKWGVK